MSKSFKLPDLGEGIHEGEVLAVPVDVGQEVKEGDIILEVETDKAAVEIPSPYTGSIQEIFVKPGDIVNVGDVMMTFTNAEGDQTVKEEKPIKNRQPRPRPSLLPPGFHLRPKRDPFRHHRRPDVWRGNSGLIFIWSPQPDPPVW